MSLLLTNHSFRIRKYYLHDDVYFILQTSRGGRIDKAYGDNIIKINPPYAMLMHAIYKNIFPP
jgi:hypothetical protein